MKPIAPNRPKNSDLRNREYLTPKEMEKIIHVSKKLGRHGLRDSTMILMTFRHGFRVSELIGSLGFAVGAECCKVVDI